MPEISYVPNGKEIVDNGEYLSAYASGKPFALHLTWAKPNKEGQMEASSRPVTPQDANNLLSLDSMKHLRDKGYYVASYGDPKRPMVLFIQDMDMRRTVQFCDIPVGKDFYRAKDRQYFLEIGDSWTKTSHQDARCFNTQEEIQFPAYEEVWRWT